MEEIEQLYAEVKDQHTMLDRLQLGADQKEEMIKRAYENMESVMSDSDEILLGLLNDHDEIMVKQEQALKSLKSQESQGRDELSQLQESYTKLCTAKGSVEALLAGQQNDISTLLDMATKFGTKYQFCSQPVSSQDDDIRSFVSKFESLVAGKKKELKRIETEKQTAEDLLTSAMSERMAELHHVKEQLRGKQQELGSLNAEKRTLASKLKQLGSHPIASATDVNEADKLVEEAQREIESFKANNDVVALKNAIQAIGKNVHDANYEIEQLDSKITVLRLQERDYISLEMKRHRIEKKRRGVRGKSSWKGIAAQSIDRNRHSQRNYLARS
ncbi:hypothetical protein PINS_up022574 [Pythium insidiosum]|nr:hypothetical protein PINS_up022574 [Pythium insidiosum]